MRNDKQIFSFQNRIQQIQLLGRDIRVSNHETLWNQLEAEIHLHRHKTVIRACRGRDKESKSLTMPPGHVKKKTVFRYSSLISIYFK